MDDWTDKHKPTCVAQMIGPKTPGDTLLNWLRTWKQSKFRCALVTGPPGCGKSLLARLACKDAGLADVVVLDSNSKRTKKTIDALQESFKTVSVKSFFVKTTTPKNTKAATTAVLVEDVDHCDQGGLPRINAFIRKALVPVICTAGDSYNKALKPLADMALAVRMFRPYPDQIAARLMQIAQAEGRAKKLTMAMARSLATACGGDIRQSIIEMQMLLHTDKFDLSKNEDDRICDREPGLFEVIPRLFSLPTQRTYKFAPECERLCLMDRSMVPLMVHENYLRAKGCVSLDAVAEAADAMSIADTMTTRAPGEIYAFYAATLPCSHICGPLMNKAGFPAMLGEFSRASRLYDTHKAISMGLGMNMSELVTERLWVMRVKYCRLFNRIPAAKIGEAARLIVAELTSSGLTKEDWDVLIGKDMARMPPAAKVAVAKAFDEATKKFKKMIGGTKGRKRGNPDEEDGEEDEDDRPALKLAKNTK